MISQDVLTGEGRVLLGQEQWPRRDPSLFLAGCTERRGQTQGGSKILNNEDVPASDGRALPDPGQLPGKVSHSPKLVVPSGQTARRVGQILRPIRMSLGTKIECFLSEDNGLVEVLHLPELLVPRKKTTYKVVHVPWPISVCLRANVECFSAEGNSLVKVLYCPKLIVSSRESKSQVV